jgi:hypothetical protein
MPFHRFRQQLRIARGLPQYLSALLTHEGAIAELTDRVNSRDARFLEVCRNLIYAVPQSPYRQLFLRAGCQYADLESSVKRHGLERTLEDLRDDGVYLSLEEFKCQVPLCRQGLTIDTRETDFDNPNLMGKGLPGSTSGSRSKSTRVLYDWDFFSEEAANELLLYAVHGLSDAPGAFWLPCLPSISGIHNLLVHLRFRRPPVKWFSHLEGNAQGRLSMQYIRWMSRFYGICVPLPEFVELKHAEIVARWMEAAKRQSAICVVKTFTSSAIRIAQAATEKGIDLSGSVIFTGGEPLTERRLRYLRSAGVSAFPRYVATETGLIGAACGNGDAPDSMHLYVDRLAVIQRQRTTRIGGQNIHSLLFSTLCTSSGKILLNVELGDIDVLHRQSCNCLYGQAGMNQHISEVRSFDKLTGEGMTLLGSILDEVIAEVVGRAGGGPDDYQFWEKPEANGLVKITIAVSPRIRNLNEKLLTENILAGLHRRSPGARVASQFWQQADTFQVVRADPEMSRGFKLLPIIKQPDENFAARNQ